MFGSNMLTKKLKVFNLLIEKKKQIFSGPILVIIRLSLNYFRD
jgi:hypothetical protein